MRVERSDADGVVLTPAWLARVPTTQLFMGASIGLLALVMVVGLDRWPELLSTSFLASMVCAGAACWEPGAKASSTQIRIRGFAAIAMAFCGTVALGEAVWQAASSAELSWIEWSQPTALKWYAALVGVVFVAALLWRLKTRWMWIVGGALIALFVVGTAVQLLDQRRPGIDVLMFQRRGGDAVIDGKNPYDASIMRLPDVYNFRIPARCLHQPGGLQLERGPKECRIVFYDPSLTDSRTLTFGYPYTVVSLAGATAGQWLVDDSRWLQLVSVVAAVSLLGAIAWLRRRWLQGAISVLLMLSVAPVWRGIKFGFIEPLVIAAFAGVVYCALRRPRLLPYALGVLLATKQYVPLVVPLLPLLVPWATLRSRAFALRLIGTAAVLSLPPLLLTGYWRSVWMVQLVQPFRSDSLSFAALWARHVGGTQPGTLFSFLPPILALVLAYRVAPRTPSGFVAACGFVFLVFFGFAKQSFSNYLSLVIGLMSIAIAAYAVEALRQPPNVTVEA